MSGCAFAWAAKSSGGGYRRSSRNIVSIACWPASAAKPPPSFRSGDPRRLPPRSRLEVVRVIRDDLGAVVGDEDDVLEPHAAVPGAVETGLDGDHVTRDERLLRDQTHSRSLMYLEPDAVAE